MKSSQYLGLDKKFPLHWKQYILQSLYATFSVFIVLLLLEMEHVVIIASIGASAFIVFTMPRSITARPRSLIGGHVIGFSTGSLIALVPHTSVLGCAATYAIAVGSAIFLMVVTDTEHPPAGGTALGVAITGFSLSIMISGLTSIILLAIIYALLKSRLVDLV